MSTQTAARALPPWHDELREANRRHQAMTYEEHLAATERAQRAWERYLCLKEIIALRTEQRSQAWRAGDVALMCKLDERLERLWKMRSRAMALGYGERAE